MELVPILSTLRRHKTAATLIVLEIAVTCAIVCNALFLIGDRWADLQQVSGVVEEELIRVHVANIRKDDASPAVTTADLAALRAIIGVKAVATTNQIPFGGSSWNSSINLARDQTHPTLNAATYMGSEDLLETFGLNLVAGRDFAPDEYIDFDHLRGLGDGQTRLPSVILTRTTADRLFPGQSALGQSIYVWGDSPIPVVGIVEHLIRPNELDGRSGRELAVILPIRPTLEFGTSYVLRVGADERTELLQAAVEVLGRMQAHRLVVETDKLTELRENRFRGDLSMAWLLVVVCVALLVVTALGIVGLASFWVQQRTRQIGIRRALGATRAQIMRYFHVENFLLTTLGIALGMVFAYAINSWLMANYELPRLPLHVLPGGAILLWLLGQLAVLGPAWRAAAVAPAIATRSA